MPEWLRGVDLRSTAGNCAWARTPQLTGALSLHSADMRGSPHPAAPVPPDRQCVALLTKDPRRVCRRWARVRGHGGEVPRRWSGSGCRRRQTPPLPRRTRVKHGGQGLASGPQVPSAYLAVADLNVMCQFARVVKGVDLRSTAGNCAWARTPQLTADTAAGLSCHASACRPCLPPLPWATCWPQARRDPRPCCNRWARASGLGSSVPLRACGI